MTSYFVFFLFIVMLQKKPKSTYWNFIKKGATILFVTEALLFAGSYGIWHRLNTNKGNITYHFSHMLYHMVFQKHFSLSFDGKICAITIRIKLFRFKFLDFRYYINENYPIILESYYKFGELLGESKIRKLDNIEWSATKATKKQE